MSVVGEKKFVIKQLFEYYSEKEKGMVLNGKEEKHFGIFWKLNFFIFWKTPHFYVYLIRLEFRKSEDVVGSEWSMDFEVDSDLYKDSTIKNRNHSISEKSGKIVVLIEMNYIDLSKYLMDNGNLEAEFQVTIKKMEGFSIPKLRVFDDDVAKELSDVVLKAGDQKFYVYKMYLASNSTYFESLFSGNFTGSKKSVIELKDIDPNDFQIFLEFIYGVALVEDNTVSKILKLADFFDAKTAIQRCEEFLLIRSEKSDKDKFELATKYNLENLKKKCISGLKTGADFRSIVPEDASKIDYNTWKELLLKSASLL